MAVTEENLLSRRPHIKTKKSSSDVLEEMVIKYGLYTLYEAGFPGFRRPFARDQFVAGELSSDPKMLKGMVEFAASIQGKSVNPRTGEEPGKIFHEYELSLKDGIELPQSPGHTTFFAACDTTALFLLAHEEYFKLTKDKSLSYTQRKNIEAAANYIVSHLSDEYVFTEDPNYAGADKFSLKVTYWKDSKLIGRKEGNPSYPVIYPLVHIQNIAGLRAASRLLASRKLKRISDSMVKALGYMYNLNLRNFPIAIDKDGIIEGLSSDGLHSLFYLEKNDLTREQLLGIIDSSRVLETSLGYRTLDPESAGKTDDKYHASTIWTHEQAQIHRGALKHLRFSIQKKDDELRKELEHVMKVSMRVNDYLTKNKGSYPEIFVVDGEEIKAGGNDPQLWAVAAKKYFDNYLSIH